MTPQSLRPSVSLALMASLVILTVAQNRSDTFRPTVRGVRGVVAGGHPLVAEAGLRMLHRGGNAVDAGVAAVLAGSVIEFSHFAFGGEVPVIIKPANKPVITINGQGQAPELATREFFEKRASQGGDDAGRGGSKPPPIPSTGPLAATVPGVLDAMVVALDNYGTMKLADVMQPAIELADAFPIDEMRVNYIRNTRRVYEQWPASRAVFLPNGQEPKVGDIFVQKDLARTLRELVGVEKKNARRGRHAALEAVRDYFYRGPLAKRYCEAVKLAFADRDRWYGDPRFVKVPGAELLAKDYAELRRGLIDPKSASTEQRPGDPVNKKSLAQMISVNSHDVPEAERASDTTCVNVIDAAGNVFSATPSGAWLPSFIAGSTGIPISSRMQSFLLTPGHPNELKPGKRPRITLSPTLVLKDGQPFAALSTPGGDNQDQALTQVLLNVIEFGMNPQEAVEAARFETAHFVSSFADHKFNPASLSLEKRFGEQTIEEMKKRGHKVDVNENFAPTSAPTIIIYDPKSRLIQAGADVRRGRYAVGW